MSWVLIIIAFTTYGSGRGVAIQAIDMRSLASCDAARKEITTSKDTVDVVAYCIQR